MPTTQEALDALKIARDALGEDIVALNVAVDQLIAAGTVDPPPPPPPPPVTDFLDVNNHSSQSLTGSGSTVVRVRWPEGGPYLGYIKGPYIATPTSVCFTNSNDAQVLTLTGCSALAVNFDLGNPDGILISTANPTENPAMMGLGFVQPGVVSDNIPFAFAFIDQTGADLSTEYISNIITISGITASVISIIGGTYSKNGGSYTSSDNTVAVGDTVSVRGTSSSSYSTVVNVTLTIGNVSDTFSITTADAVAGAADPSFITHGIDTAATPVTLDLGTGLVKWSFYTPEAVGESNGAGPRTLLLNPDGTVTAVEHHLSGQYITMTNCVGLIVADINGNPIFTMLAVDALPGTLPGDSGGSGGGGGGGGGSTPLITPTIPSPVIATVMSNVGMAALVHFDGGATAIFNQADGTDIGDYTNLWTGSVHKNIAVLGANFYQLIFRPENSGSRFEVEMRWGILFSGIQPDLGPITVEVFNNGVKIGEKSAPLHIWLMSWFWESAPRPVIKTPSQFVSGHWGLPFSASVCPRARPANAPAYAPMSHSDVLGYMPQTGARYDIGLQHTRAAYWLATGDATMQQSVLDWGFSAYSLPTNVVDLSTNAPVNLQTYILINFCDRRESSNPLTPGFTTDGRSNGVYFGESSHLPELAYVPFFMTGDVKHLISMQNIMTVMLSQTSNCVGPIRSDQTRTWGWGVRCLFNLCRAMKEFQDTSTPVPSFLHPYSYWKFFLDQNLAWFMASVNDPSPPRSVFRFAGQLTGQAFWQHDYVAQVLADGVYKGNADWNVCWQWMAQQAIARTNGTSGWDRRIPSFYFVAIWKQHQDGTPTTSADNNFVGLDPVSSWGELLSFNGMTSPPSFNGKFAQFPGFDVDFHYVALTRAVLAIATNISGLEVSGAAACYTWLDDTPSRSGMDWQESFF